MTDADAELPVVSLPKSGVPLRTRRTRQGWAAVAEDHEFIVSVGLDGRGYYASCGRRPPFRGSLDECVAHLDEWLAATKGADA